MVGAVHYIFRLLCIALFVNISLLRAEEYQFAALFVDGEEQSLVFFKHKKGDIYLEKDALLDIPKITVSEANDTIETPIGTVPYSALIKDGSGFTLGQLEKVLKIQSKYSEKNVALYLRTPWYHVRNTKGRKKHADILPESSLFNGFRLDSIAEYINESMRYRSELQLSGYMFDGITRISALKAQDSQYYLNELMWLKKEDRYSVLLGLQNTQPHLLLPYEEMTGIQAVWTNYDMPDFSDRIEPTLRPTLGPDNRIITGKGPPGGSVVLRINDKAVLAVRIRLDGTYRIDVSQQNLLGVSLVELWIYERDPLGAPIKKINLSYLREDRLLEKGQVSVLAGGGAGGNILNPNLPQESSKTVGNVYARYGVSDSLTLEGGMMKDSKERTYLLLAVTASLGEHYTLHAALGLQDGQIASYLTLNGHWDDDYMIARWRDEPKDYRGTEYSTQDGYFDYTKKISDTLSLGLNGRYYIGNNEKVTFLLPTVRYSPLSNLSLTLIPNYDGYYRFDALYTPNEDLRVNYTFEEDEHRLSVVEYLTDEWGLYFDGVTDTYDEYRYEAGVTWRDEDRNDLYFEAGAIYSDGKLGFKANMRHNLLPGVYAKYEIRDEPYLKDGKEFYCGVNIIVDFAFIQGKFHPTDAPEIERNLRGSIVGNVYKAGTETPIDSEDIQILLNNSPRKAGEAQGQFYIGNLKQGIYTVKLDPASLPMEYTPVKSSYNVKVADGAVSKVDFYVETFYGIAGKLHRPVSDTPVTVVLTANSNGKTYTTLTDQFDYYRFDAVPPGTYTLSVDDKKLRVTPRAVVVKDDFLFDQDLFAH